MIPKAKLTTARRVLATDGLSGAVRAFTEQRTVTRTADFLRYWTRQHDYPTLGRVLARFTESVTVDGLTFHAPRALVDDTLRCRLWLGRYERPERTLLARHLDPSRPVIELGGGLGVVACTLNRRLLDPSRHVVVEANPDMHPVLAANRARNGARFTIVPCALGYSPTVGLQPGVDCLSTATVPDGPVSTITLRTLAEAFDVRDGTLVCDIEGAEVDLVAHESDLLAERVRLLVLEEHPRTVSADDRLAMADRLRWIGFRLIDQYADTMVWVR